MTNLRGYSMNGKALMNKFFPTNSEYKPVKANAKDDFAVFCERRFQEMARARSTWYSRMRRTYGLWDVFQDWLLEGENFNKAVRFPTLRDVAKGIKTEIMRTPPDVNLEPEFGDHKFRAQALEHKLQSVLSSLDEKRVQEECIDDMLFYGIGTRMTGYYNIKRETWDEDNKKEIVTEFSDVGTERIDPRNVFFDDQGRYMYNQKGKDIKRDVFIKFQIPWSTWEDWSADNANFINPLSIPKAEKALSGDMNYPSSRESEEFQTLTKSSSVDFYMYYNQQLNVFGGVANGQTVIKPRPIPNKHGRIPLVTYIFERRRDSFYPNSLAELLAPAIYAQDSIFNLQLMGMKLDLMPAVMVDSELGYNSKIHKMSPRAVWEMNVPQGKSMQNMVYPFQRQQSNQGGAANMINQIESQITITSGQDRRSLFVNPNQTATQTVAKEQSAQKTVQSVVFSNELEAEGHIGEMMISDIKQYGSDKVKRNTNGKEKKEYRKVKVEGWQVIQNAESHPEFIPAQGEEGLFELNPETVDVDVRVVVKDTRTKMMLQEQKVAKLNTGIPAIANFVSIGSQFDPNVGKAVDWSGIIQQWVEAMDLEIKRTMKNVKGEIRDRVQMEHEAMTANIKVPVPVEEDFETSKKHLQEHWRFKWIYKKGKRTARETAVWKQLSAAAKKQWSAHIAETEKNIIKKLQELVQTADGQKEKSPEQQAKEQMGVGAQIGNGPQAPQQANPVPADASAGPAQNAQQATMQ